MKPIILGTVAGAKLNLNGDQGNLLALKRFLEAAGLSVEVRPVTNTADATACHFVLLGHGSMAAMESLNGQLKSFDWPAVTAATPGLAIGSGFEWLAANVLGVAAGSVSERISEFQFGSLGALNVLGYRNAQTELPNIRVEGQLICSMLHGPILAKNPQLLHRAALAACTKAGISLPQTAELKAWVEHLNRICAQIWALEAPDSKFEPLAI